MNPLKTAAIAVSTFSVIPVPHFSWRAQDIRFSLCALPLVGAVCGALLYGWAALCTRLSLSPLLFAAVSVCLPVAVTGGIHLDGFCDVSDALASHQSTERKLEILKDSRVGAFAVIKLCCYLLLQLALYAELGAARVAPVAVGFVLSRALSAFLAYSLPKARRDGMLFSSTGVGLNRPAAAFSLALAVLSAAAMALLSPAVGALTALVCTLWCLAYKRLTAKNFGATTGDTAGYFLQICELLILAAALTVSTIGE